MANEGATKSMLQFARSMLLTATPNEAQTKIAVLHHQKIQREQNWMIGHCQPAEWIDDSIRASLNSYADRHNTAGLSRRLDGMT